MMPETSKPLSRDRLKREQDEVRRAFAFHPFVHVVPCGVAPSLEYHVTYTVRTLETDDADELKWAERATLHVWVPPEFPEVPALFRPITRVFHPNISVDGVVGLPPWNSRLSLAHLITQVGYLLAFRIMNVEEVVDAAALAWVQVNEAEIPTDTQADFAVNAGGAPIGRITKNANGAIAAKWQEMDRLLQDELTKPVKDLPRRQSHFVRSTQELLLLLSTADMPAEIRSEAARLEKAFASLTSALSHVTTLAKARDAGRWINVEIPRITEMTRALRDRCDACDAAFAGVLADEQLPASTQLGVWEKQLNTLIGSCRSVQDQMASACQKLGGLSTIDVESLSQQGQSVGQAAAETAAALAQLPERADAVKSAMEAALERAKVAVSVVQRGRQWREYLDVCQRMGALQTELLEAKAAEIGAVFVENESDSYGPYQFEQSIALGDVPVTARRRPEGSFYLIDARTGKILGSAVDDHASVKVVDPSTKEPVSYRVRGTRHYDEYQSELQRLIQSMNQLMAAVKLPFVGNDSNLSALIGRMQAEPAMTVTDERHRELQSQAAALAEDLGELGLAKERLATYLLVKRHFSTMPAALDRIQKHETIVRNAAAGLSQITARSSRTKSNQLEIPADLIADYRLLRQQRESSEHALGKLRRRFDNAVQQLQARLNQPESWGSAAFPAMTLMSGLDPELTQRLMTASDQGLLQMLSELEDLLQLSLRPASWEAETEAVADESAEEAVDEGEEGVYETNETESEANDDEQHEITLDESASEDDTF